MEIGHGGENVGARLSAELARLAGSNSFQILDVSPDAGFDAVRASFLEKTKRFHPNRFALESAETRNIANEVFLLIRKAYEQLSDETRRKTLRDKLSAPARNPQSATPPHGARSTTGAIPVMPSPAPAATATPAAPVRPRSPDTNTPAAGNRAAVPPTRTPAPGTNPPAKPSVTTNPVRTWSPAMPATAAPAAPPAAAAPPAPAAPAPPVAAAAPPAKLAPQAPAAPGRSTSRGMTPLPRPAEEVQAMLELAKTRGARFEEALKLMGMGRYKQAREALHKIAAEDPQSKKVRVQLHLAWGHEHKGDKLHDDAVREFERALALDPECSEAAEALRKMNDQKKPGGGILSKLFGR